MSIIQAEWSNRELLEYAKNNRDFKLLENYIRERKVDGLQFLQFDQKKIDSLLTSNMTAKSAIEKIISRSKSDDSNMQKLNNMETEDELKLDKNLNSKKNELSAFLDDDVPQQEFQEFLELVPDEGSNTANPSVMPQGDGYGNSAEMMDEIQFYIYMDQRYQTNIDNDDQREKMNRFFSEEYEKYKQRNKMQQYQPHQMTDPIYYNYPQQNPSMPINGDVAYCPEMGMQIVDRCVGPDDLANNLSQTSISHSNHNNSTNNNHQHYQHYQNNNNNVPYRQ